MIYKFWITKIKFIYFIRLEAIGLFFSNSYDASLFYVRTIPTWNVYTRSIMRLACKTITEIALSQHALSHKKNLINDPFGNNVAPRNGVMENS